MNEMGYLALGFGLIWLILGGYLVWIGWRQTLLDRELKRLTLTDSCEVSSSSAGRSEDTR